MMNDRESTARSGTIRNDRGFLAPALVGVLLGGLLLAAGCGRQDRLVPVAPEVSSVLDVQPWGTLIDEEAVFYPTGMPAAAAARDLDDFCLGTDGGVVVRVQGDRLARLDIPARETVCGLHYWSADVIEAVDERGVVWYHEGGAWEQRHDLEADDCRGVCSDGAQGLWIYGDEGLLVHQTGGDWHDYSRPDSLDLIDAWVAPDGVAWFIDRTAHLVRAENGIFSQERLTGFEGVVLSSYSLRIEGTPDGYLAVANIGTARFWMRTQGGWSYHEPSPGWSNRLSDLFWKDDELYGVLTDERQLVRWNGESWTVLRELPEAPGYIDNARRLRVDGRRLLVFEGGMVVDLAADPPRTLLPPLGRVVGAAVVGGELHAGLQCGGHLVRRTDHWQLSTSFPVEGGSLLFEGIGAAPSDAVVAIGNRSISRIEDGQEPVLIEGPSNRNSEVYRVGPDEALLRRWNGEIWRCRGSSIEPAGSIASGILNTLCPDGDGGFYALRGYRLLHAVEGEEKLIRILSGWNANTLLLDPVRGLVVAGDRRTLLQDADGFGDITPWRSAITGLLTVSIADLCLDGRGGWLALSDEIDRVLRYDGETWIDPELSLADVPLLTSSQSAVQRTVAGEFLIYSRFAIARVVPGSEVSR